VTWTKIIRPCDECHKDYEANARSVDGKEIIANTLCRECRDKRMMEEEKNKALHLISERSPSIREMWLKESGLPPKFINKTLADFENDKQAKAYRAIKDYTGEKSLVLLSSSGIYGIGKTHLCAALVHQIIGASETMIIDNDFTVREISNPVKFITEDEIISGIRYTFNDPKAAPTEEHIYGGLARVEHLIVDDVGKTHPKDYSFVNDVYYRIINTRYSRLKPIVITTNLDLEELEKHIGGACADRLREMCGKAGFIKMTGESYRKK
jgi:DNA replication protein DnaC